MISVASSISFKKQDGLLPSFDNTLHADRTDFRIAKHPFYQTFFTTDKTVKIQAELTTGQVLSLQQSDGTLKMGQVVWSAFTSMTGEELVISLANYDYWECVIDMSLYKTGYVKFRAVILEDEAVVETWLSEPCEVIDPDYIRYLQIEYFMYDENAFNCYYVNKTEADRLTGLIRIRGTLRDYKPGGETDVFDNQNEVIKTKAVLKRMMTLKTEPIPDYMAEKLSAALAHDKFFVNEVEFVAEKEPEYDQGNGDIAALTCQLTQRAVIGLNAHDTGYNCDATTGTDMIVLQELSASGQKSFTITDDYMVLTITGEQTAGSPVITAGTTPGGTDILLGMNLSATYVAEVALVPVDKASIPGGTLYVTISGVGATANIYIATIKNRQ